MAAGLRRIAYSGSDKEADKAFRNVSDQLNFFQKLPTVDGVKLDEQKFTSGGSDKSHPLNHKLGRKARGICIMACHPVASAIACPSVPVHDRSNTNETNDTAMVFLTVDMADNFTWDFWVW